MKKCKQCNGKGFMFIKSTVFTGKEFRIMGVRLPETTDGMVQVQCSKCWGKGIR